MWYGIQRYFKSDQYDGPWKVCLWCDCTTILLNWWAIKMMTMMSTIPRLAFTSGQFLQLRLIVKSMIHTGSCIWFCCCANLLRHLESMISAPQTWEDSFESGWRGICGSVGGGGVGEILRWRILRHRGASGTHSPSCPRRGININRLHRRHVQWRVSRYGVLYLSSYQLIESDVWRKTEQYTF